MVEKFEVGKTYIFKDRGFTPRDRITDISCKRNIYTCPKQTVIDILNDHKVHLDYNQKYAIEVVFDRIFGGFWTWDSRDFDLFEESVKVNGEDYV